MLVKKKKRFFFKKISTVYIIHLHTTTQYPSYLPGPNRDPSARSFGGNLRKWTTSFWRGKFCSTPWPTTARRKRQRRERSWRRKGSLSHSSCSTTVRNTESKLTVCGKYKYIRDRVLRSECFVDTLYVAVGIHMWKVCPSPCNIVSYIVSFLQYSCSTISKYYSLV